MLNNATARFLQALVLVFILLIIASQFYSENPIQPTEKTYGQFINIYGEKVELSDYFGKYLWVDYAAEWCSYCEPQTRTLKSLASKYHGKIDFLTIVTGTSKVMEAPTVEHIKAWSEKYDIDSRKIIGRFYTDRLPYNLLYSPGGKVLFRYSGLMKSVEIEQVIKKSTTL
jgi:thiol-disulfide isomerase/thioredoxin